MFDGVSAEQVDMSLRNTHSLSLTAPDSIPKHIKPNTYKNLAMPINIKTPLSWEIVSDYDDLISITH